MTSLPPTTLLSPEEVHLLIFKYLQESGFTHSSFVFANESLLGHSSSSSTASIPCGSLLSFLHKGLLFEQLERDINKRAKPTIPLVFKESALIPLKQSSDSSQPGVLVLKGHAREVFAVKFNAKDGNVVATGAGDGVGRIWNVKDKDSVVLEHVCGTGKSEAVDVTTLVWNPDGTVLATGAVDGRVRLWAQDGTNVASLIKHLGPVFSIKWSSLGGKILSGGQDRTVVVWDVLAKAPVMVFDFHALPTLDVDWRPSNSAEVDDDVFASCSSDHTIVICKSSTGEAVRIQNAHGDDINAVKWSENGMFLASCSDDCTAKIFQIPAQITFSDSIKNVQFPCQELLGHSKEVYAIKWCPGEHKNIVATASFDTTVKLWDTETGKALHTLSKQIEPVYAIEFDPLGETILSGSFDGFVNVWNVETGSLLKSIKVAAGVFDVSWNIRGDKFAAAVADGSVVIVDF